MNKHRSSLCSSCTGGLVDDIFRKHSICVTVLVIPYVDHRSPSILRPACCLPKRLATEFRACIGHALWKCIPSGWAGTFISPLSTRMDQNLSEIYHFRSDMHIRNGLPSRILSWCHFLSRQQKALCQNRVDQCIGQPVIAWSSAALSCRSSMSRRLKNGSGSQQALPTSVPPKLSQLSCSPANRRLSPPDGRESHNWVYSKIIRPSGCCLPIFLRIRQTARTRVNLVSPPNSYPQLQQVDFI
jgi:hypothetical protein